jgi:hypothetical protein
MLIANAEWVRIDLMYDAARGESVNTLTTYGYDPATGMQEPKATPCQIRAA